MPKKTKGKKAKRQVTRKSVGKKITKKRRVKKKVSVKKKSAKKKAAKKKTAGRKPKKRTVKVKPPRRTAIPKKTITIEPGPPSINVTPVEEPAPNEEAIGTVTHYYDHLGVAVVQINKDELKTGDMIHIKGHTTDFTQKTESIEYEHQHIDQASAGQSVGLKVNEQVHEHDIVYRIK